MRRHWASVFIVVVVGALVGATAGSQIAGGVPVAPTGKSDLSRSPSGNALSGWQLLVLASSRFCRVVLSPDAAFTVGDPTPRSMVRSRHRVGAPRGPSDTRRSPRSWHGHP